MTKRINIVMPIATIKTIDKLVQPGQRSQFIAKAVDYVTSQGVSYVSSAGNFGNKSYEKTNHPSFNP